MIEQRDMLLVPFPFSDQSGKKVRPIVIVSNDNFNCSSEDVIAVAVTSNITKDNYTVPLTPEDIQEGDISHKCCIKAENILKLDKKLIIKKIGKINEKRHHQVTEIIKKIIE